jgi:putrescine oxidase
MADGRVVRAGGDDLGLAPDGVAAYEAGVEQLRLLVAEVDPEAPWDHPDARRLDTMSYEQWLQAEVPHPEARDVLRFVASGFMTKPADAFSLLQTAWLLSSAGAVEHLLDEDEVLDARIVGGAQQIAERLAERLAGRVRLGVPVRDIAWDDDDGVRVRAGGAEIGARAAVLALPPNLLPSIRFDPPLPGRRMQTDQWLAQGALIKVQAAYPTPFWRADGLSGTAFGTRAIVSEVYDNSPPSGSPGVLIGFISDHAADAAAALSPEERRAAVLDAFAGYFGPRALGPTHYVERDWTTEEWTRGAYSATFAIGALSRYGRTLREPVGPLRFAGADIAGAGNMHIDGAVRSGEAVASELLRDLVRRRQGDAGALPAMSQGSRLEPAARHARAAGRAAALAVDGRGPADRIRQHPPHVGVVVDRVVLVPGAEVEDPPAAAAEATSAAEDLTARERADEHERVGDRDVEVLAVHLLGLDHDRVRDPGRDRVTGVDGPHELALALVAPAQAAGGAEQAAEDLRVVPGVQHEQPHAAKHRVLDPVDDRVVDLVVRYVAPPRQHVGGVDDGSAQPVLGLLERRGAHAHVVAQQLAEARRDRAVDSVGIDRAHVRLLALVHVLAPDGHADHAQSLSPSGALPRSAPAAQ